MKNAVHMARFWQTSFCPQLVDKFSRHQYLCDSSLHTLSAFKNGRPRP